MKKIYFAVLLSLFFNVAQSQEKDPLRDTKTKLINILACNEQAKPSEVVSLINSLGGIAIINHSSKQNYDFTLPNSIEMFGRKVSRILIHPASDNYGSYNEYGAIFEDEIVDVVAALAGVTLNKNGKYLQNIGNHDFSIREENGVTAIVCAYDVRTVWKSLNHFIKK